MCDSVDRTALADRDLVGAARQGDRQAFGALVCRYWEGVVGVVYRMCGDLPLAEEATQEAFVRAWSRLDSYHPERSFRNWMYAIAVHLALDMLRKERKTAPVDGLPLHAPGGGPEVELEAKERAERVRQSVLELPPASRAVLVLREYEGLSYREIAQALGIPVGTVMSRLNYARGQLRVALAGELEAL